MRSRLLYLLIWFMGLLLLLTFSAQIYPSERNNVANGLYDRQDYAHALDAYQLAQVNAPDQWEYYYNAASVMAQTGRLRAAVAALEQALESDSDVHRTQAYYNLGHVAYQLGRYGDAVEAFREVLRHTPDDTDARHNYELALAHQLPTPTPQEQQTDPEEDETNPQSTPTSNPADQEPATPTPDASQTSIATQTSSPDEPNETPSDNNSTPAGGESDPVDDSATPVPNTGSPLSLNDIERQFDAIQDAQLTLREALNRAGTPERSNEKDW